MYQLNACVSQPVEGGGHLQKVSKGAKGSTLPGGGESWVMFKESWDTQRRLGTENVENTTLSNERK